MLNYRQADAPGGTYFFTVNSLHRLPVLTEEPVRETLREAIRQTRLTNPFEIDAWVLLPDHLHCIWTMPPGDADFARHVDYIHWNPVKHGLVNRACDWPYSTFHRFVREGKCSSDWGLSESIALAIGAGE